MTKEQVILKIKRMLAKDTRLKNVKVKVNFKDKK